MRNPFQQWTIALLMALFVSVGANLRAYDEVAVEHGGSISGVVIYDGAPPERKKLDVKAPCENHEALSEDLIVTKAKEKEQNVLVNAVVSIVEIKKGKAFSKDVPAIDQKGCVFKPHVVVMPAEGTLTIQNSDEVIHNVHTTPELNRETNDSVSPKGKTSKKFDEPERIPVRCDVHTWMRAWIVVAGNPYFHVTGEDGTFKLDQVPPGKYTINVWHEKLGEQKKEVTVEAGADARVEFTFKGK